MRVLPWTKIVLFISATILLVFVLYANVTIRRRQFMDEYLKQLHQRFKDGIIFENKELNFDKVMFEGKEVNFVKGNLFPSKSSASRRIENSVLHRPSDLANASALLSSSSIKSSNFTEKMNSPLKLPTTISAFRMATKRKSKYWCEDLSGQYPLVLNFTHLVSTKEKVMTEPIHLHPFHYIFNASHTCKADKTVKIICVVKSRVDNFSLRKVIRETWVKDATADGSKVVFSLGNSKKQSIRDKVKEEYDQFKDIVQENFYDNYYNNSLKTIMGIRWIAKFCSNAVHVLMVDDDVMVNYRNLAGFFESVSPNRLDTLYTGNIKPRPGPIRNNRVRWHMPKDQYPYDCYPPYLSGGALLTSGEVTRKINLALPYVKRFKYDDVYLAIVVQKLGIRPQGNSKVVMRRVSVKQLRQVVVSHGFSKSGDYLKTYKDMKAY